MLHLKYFGFLVLFFAGTLGAYSQEVTSNDNLFAVVEFSKADGLNNFKINIVSTNTFKSKLKRATKSERSVQGRPSFKIQLLDESQNIIDEIIQNDPLMVNYEYVNDEGNLTHKWVEEETRTIIIRRPLPKRVTHLSIKQNSLVRSDISVTAKINRS